MNFWDKVSSFFRPGRGLVVQEKQQTRESLINWASAGVTSREPENLASPYRQHAWVYACVRAIAERCSSVPYTLYSDKSGSNAIETGDLYRVFNRPNAWWSRYHLWQTSVSHLMMHGNCIWVLQRNSPEEVPTEIWAHSHKRFKKIYVPRSRDIAQWEFTQTKDDVKYLKPWNVVWFHLPNLDETGEWGQAPYEAARRSAEQDYLAAIFNRSFFENSCTPGGFIEYPADSWLTKDQRDAALRMFNELHQGVRRSFNIGILEGGAKYSASPLSHKEMAFIEQRSLSAREICAVFHVPPSIVENFDGVQKHVQEGVNRQFWEGTIIPVLALVEETLRAQFWLPYDDERTWGTFDTSSVQALQESVEGRLERAHKTWSMGVPFNDVNVVYQLGFDPIEGGDVGFVSSDRIPVKFKLEQYDPEGGLGPVPSAPRPEDGNRPKPGPDGNDGEDDPGTIDQEPDDSDVKPPKPPSKQWHSLALRRGSRDHREEDREWLILLGALEARYKGALRTYLGRVIRWSLLASADAFERYGTSRNLPEDVLLLPRRFDDELRSISQRHFYRVARTVGPEIERRVRAAGRPFVFDPFSRTILNVIRAKVDTAVRHVNDEGIRDKLRAVSRDVASVETSLAEYQDKIHGTLRDARTRATGISRTETAQLASGLQFQASKDAGVRYHQWIAVMDERTRATHWDNMDLGPWPVGVPFPNNCLYPGDPNGPAEEVINCRCHLRPLE